jgi:hypothetical protein
MLTSLLCGVALGVAADRRMQTPTSGASCSTAQAFHQAEEDRQVRVPAQQPVNQPPTGPYQLARQPYESIDERLEL